MISIFAVIHSKHLPAILYLLVALAKQFNCPFKLPKDVILNVVVVQVNVFFMNNIIFAIIAYCHTLIANTLKVSHHKCFFFQKRQGILRSKTVPENVTEDFG